MGRKPQYLLIYEGIIKYLLFLKPFIVVGINVISMASMRRSSMFVILLVFGSAYAPIKGQSLSR